MGSRVTPNGAKWRSMPHDLPPWKTVYDAFRSWQRRGIIDHAHDLCTQAAREVEGREPDPTACIIDSQSVQCTEKGGVRGYDAGKKIKGRKREIATDVNGNILHAEVEAASVQEHQWAKTFLLRLHKKFPTLRICWVDAGFVGLEKWAEDNLTFKVVVIKRPQGKKGFIPLPRRWVVERTFAWFGIFRIMAKEYHQLCETSLAWIHICMIDLITKRLSKLS